MPFGIQRCVAGSETSIVVPAASSARLQQAIAWNVPMWLCTARRFLARTSPRPGARSTKTGRTGRKYGASQQTARENSRSPRGSRETRRYRPRRGGMPVIRADAPERPSADQGEHVREAGGLGVEGLAVDVHVDVVADLDGREDLP